MTTTFETSKRLKEAGFPQPEPHYRQVWHTSDGVDCFTLGRKTPQGRFWADDKILKPDFHTSPDVVFAPTESDILPELPTTFRLGASVFEKDGERHVEFVAWNVVEGDVEMISAYHPNAAEALARVWLELEAANKRAEQVNPSGA